MATLSDRIIRDLKPAAADTWISDGDGLNIRIRQNGTKTWVIRRKRGGKTTTETLGEYPSMDCKAARAAAAKRSLSPNLARLTFAELLDEWYARMIGPKYRVTKNVEVYVRRAKAEFGATSIGRITRPQLVRWLQKYADDTPVAANRCLATMKLALNYADQCGYIDRNPLALVTADVIGGKEKTRDRHLTDDEIRALWASGHKLLRLLLLTGLRISEAQQGYRDGDRFCMDRTKNGDPHWVALPALAAEQVDRFDTSPTAVQAWLRRWCEREHVSPFTPHDLRRTFATRLAGLSIPPHIIEKCLNHRMQGVMGIYNRADYEAERIAAAQAWADELSRILKAGSQGAPTPSNP